MPNSAMPRLLMLSTAFKIPYLRSLKPVLTNDQQKKYPGESDADFVRD
jgi:hypothetical protein